MANSGVEQSEVNINNIVTDLNNKVDLDGTNANFPHVVSRTSNSYGGVVEIWSDGYCVQTGQVTIAKQNANTSLSTAVTLPQPYKMTDYYVAPLTFITDGGNTTGLRNHANDRTTTTLTIKTYSTTSISNNYTAQWRTEGYIR